MNHQCKHRYLFFPSQKKFSPPFFALTIARDIRVDASASRLQTLLSGTGVPVVAVHRGINASRVVVASVRCASKVVVAHSRRILASLQEKKTNKNQSTKSKYFPLLTRTGSHELIKQAFRVQLIGANWHPRMGSQVSVVHTDESLQAGFGALKQYLGGTPNTI
jgi:hypothetical protein